MKKLIASIALVLVATLGLAACSAPASTPKISADTVVVDVRTPGEFSQGHLARAINIDVTAPDFDGRISKLPTDGKYVVYCRSGNRSAPATERMRQLGFTDVTDAGAMTSATESTGLDIVTTP